MQNSILNNSLLGGALVAVAGAATVALLAFTYETFQGDPYAADAMATISVSGEGTVLAVPDIGTFQFSVVAESETAAEAQDSAAVQHNDIIDFLRESGVDEADIKTVGYNLRPRYRFVEPVRGGTRERELIGYEVRQTVEVRVRDIDEAGTLLVGAGERGASNISSLQFTIDDESVYLDEARALAIEDAKERADRLAEQLGVQLVRVVEFSEDSYSMPPFMTRSPMMDSVETEAVTAPDLPVGENEIMRQVTITYEVR